MISGINDRYKKREFDEDKLLILNVMYQNSPRDF